MLSTVNSAKRSATKEEIIFDSKVSDIVLATRNAQKDKTWLQPFEGFLLLLLFYKSLLREIIGKRELALLSGDI